MFILASARASATRASMPGRLSRKMASCFVISIIQALFGVNRCPYGPRAESIKEGREKRYFELIVDNNRVWRQRGVVTASRYESCARQQFRFLSELRTTRRDRSAPGQLFLYWYQNIFLIGLAHG